MGSRKVQLKDSFSLLNGTYRLKNRFVKSAMSEQLGNSSHDPGEELVALYGQWAEGGTGLLITGNIMVDRTALGEPANVVLDEKSDLSMFYRWAQAGSKNGSQIWAQLNHPGKQTPVFLSKEPVAPSAIPLEKGLEKSFRPPRALEEEEIRAVIKRFVTSAVLAKKTGFSGVQIHGAHGYLVSQFLSRRHNKRNDKWGGSPEKRMYFVTELYRSLREALGSDFPVGIKLNSADFMEDGLAEDESVLVAKKLSELGIDLIEISGGTYESPAMMGSKESTLRREAYFLNFAEKIREVVSTPLVVTGGFRSGRAMNEAVASGAVDFVGLARPLTLEPDLPEKIMADPEYRLELPKLTTGLALVDKISMLNITWYEHQIARLGKSLRPDPFLSPWISLFKTLGSLGMYSLKKRRM